MCSARTMEFPRRPSGRSRRRIQAKDVRALAREWGKKRTYLAAGGIIGFGGACRTATELTGRAAWFSDGDARLGKPGVNFGCLQQGTPVDTRFFFRDIRKVVSPEIS